MQIVSEIAEIVASAIDCVLVLWFLTSHFGKKKTIEWWKYAVWFVILFIPSHFMGEIFKFTKYCSNPDCYQLLNDLFAGKQY